METPRGSGQLVHDAGGVVGAKLFVTDATGPGADGVGGCFKGDGLEAGGVIGADRGSDDKEESGARGTDTKGTLGAN